MAGRARSPNADFKVILHQTGGYRYAATQPYEKDDKTGKIRRHYVYWGDVTEEMKFIPNQRFCLTDSNTRGKLEFPESWDLSAIEKLTEEENRRPLSYDPSYENDGSAFSGTVRTTAGDEQFNNRFYGGTWFLWEMAVSKHVVEDLLSVFDGNQLVVNDIMTLAMFPIMTKWSYSQTERWQTYTKVPSARVLSPSYITRFTQSITDNHRMSFLKLRIKRQNPKAVLACDSTTRSAYGRCLADIRWGKNKDNEALQNTLEVVVYSLDSHEPIYYRTFGGNENDSRTLHTIIEDLQKLECNDLLVVFDRGYETEDNIVDMIQRDQAFLVCGKVGQNPVYNSILRIQYDAQGMPANMEYYDEEKIFLTQFEEDKNVSDPEHPEQVKQIKLKINLFLDMNVRIERLTKINESIRKEKQAASKLNATDSGVYSDEDIRKLRTLYTFHKIYLSSEKKLIVTENEKVISKAKNTAGIFASISYKVDGDARRQFELYALRDEQEKYFEEMKVQLGFNMQNNWSEDGKTGRLFILFIGLILRSHLRHIWSEKLRKNYPSSIDVLHEMLPIRYIEYPDGSSSVTGFTTPQVEISMAYSLPVPQSSLSSTQKAAMERKLAGRGRGRPKGSLNKKTILNFA